MPQVIQVYRSRLTILHVILVYISQVITKQIKVPCKRWSGDSGQNPPEAEGFCTNVAGQFAEMQCSRVVCSCTSQVVSYCSAWDLKFKFFWL